AEGCSATGWVYSLWAAHVWLIGHYPLSVQEEVFSDPDALVSSVVNTSGMPERVEGGFRWSGTGFFSSGVDHSTWLIAAIDVDPERKPLGDRRWFLIPRGDYEVVDDWHTGGLRGTGSKTIQIDDVFIPDERIVIHRELSEGKGEGARL